LFQDLVSPGIEDYTFGPTNVHRLRILFVEVIKCNGAVAVVAFDFEIPSR